MEKENNIFKSPQYRLILERREEWLKQMTEDEKKQSFHIPEDWEEGFRHTMNETLERKKQKKRRSRIWAVGSAAAVVLMLGIFCTSQSVHGKGWFQIIKDSFLIDGTRYTSFGERENYGFIVKESEENTDIREKTMKQVCQEFCNEGKKPVLCLGYVPSGYHFKKKVYENKFGLMNICLKKKDSYIFASQVKMEGKQAFGQINNDSVATVKNDNLKEKISIYEAEQEGTYTFYVETGDSVFTCSMDEPLEECKKIAKNIYLITGEEG